MGSRAFELYLHETRNQLSLVANRTNTLTLRMRRPLRLAELPEELGFHPQSAVLLPEPPAGASRDALTGLVVVAAALDYGSSSGDRLLVTGHSQQAPDLTERRARVVAACLLGDRASFGALCQESHTPADVRSVLSWAARTRGWDCEPEGDDDPRALDAFRQHHQREHGGSAAQGPVSAADWEALHDCYDAELAALLDEPLAGLAARRERLRPIELPGAAGPAPTPAPAPPPPAPPPPRPRREPGPTVRRGEQGDAVRELQEILVACGYPIEVDGIFGPATQAAVRAFQQAEGLAVDGIVGPLTWGALIAAEPAPAPAPAPPPPAPPPPPPPPGSALPAVGCDAHWPLDRVRLVDHTGTVDDRIDLLFFVDDHVPHLRCHASGGCAWKRCDVYRKGKYQQLELATPESDLPPSLEADPPFELQVVNASGLPVPGVFCEVLLPDGTQHGALTDDQGLVRLDAYPHSGVVSVDLPELR